MRIQKRVRHGIPLMGVDVKWFYMHPHKMRAASYVMPGEHFHDYYELVFQFSAKPVLCTVNGEPYRTDSPVIWFRAPYVMHSVSAEEEYVRTMVAFQPRILSEYKNVLDLGNLSGRQACMIPCTEAVMARLDQILTRMQRIWQDGDSEEAWICLLGALLYEVGRMATDAPSVAAEIPHYMHDILRYIGENPGEDLSSTALAKRFFVGRTKLTADFSAALGMTPHEFVTAIRITQAKQWLTDGVSIDAIAQRCGFSQESSFIYMFRREVGMTPGEWRKSRG